MNVFKSGLTDALDGAGCRVQLLSPSSENLEFLFYQTILDDTSSIYSHYSLGKKPKWSIVAPSSQLANWQFRLTPSETGRTRNVAFIDGEKNVSLSLSVFLFILERERGKEGELETERKGMRVRENREKMGAMITLNGHIKVGNI